MDADQSNSSERVLRPMDIDEQELIPDYAALPQAGNLEGLRAMTGRPLEAEQLLGKEDLQQNQQAWCPWRRWDRWLSMFTA